MIKDHKVVAWTPWGRQATASILGRYLRREHERGLVDEWWLCLNTDPEQVDDLKYAYALAAVYPWVRIVQRGPDQPRRTPKQRNTGYFYTRMTDPDTIYLRLDDDIVYVHEDAVERLVVHRVEHGQGVASFPIMWNNAIISWYAQQAGVIPAPGTITTFIRSEVFGQVGHHTEEPQGITAEQYVWPRVGGPYCMDPVGWSDGRFAVALHRLLLERVRAGKAEELFLYQDMPVAPGVQFSVSTFASSGKLYASLDPPGVLVPYEEENWHTVHQPAVLGQPNIIVGDALVSHYTFFPQKPVVAATDVLDQYRGLAALLT
jgi:hypothetical protein